MLDNELSELNFTDAYLKSISNPKDIEFNLNPIEAELKLQVKNTTKFKDIIHEDKDLTTLIGVDSSLDIDVALRQMVTYYENYKGRPYLALHNFSINDSQIIKHLNQDIAFDRAHGVLIVDIEDFPNERGYFTLWELSLADKPQAKRVMPVFINESYILRPLAGKKIWDEMINTTSKINANNIKNIDEAVFNRISEISQEFAYETFLDMKADFEKRNEETFRKYLYALDLRIEAATHIGIENIRKHKLMTLSKEKSLVEEQYKTGKQICPEFKPIFMAYLE